MAITGRDVHRAWRDSMLEQDRRVPARRLEWDTLSEQDQELDAKIAARLTRVVDEELTHVFRRRELPPADTEFDGGV